MGIRVQVQLVTVVASALFAACEAPPAVTRPATASTTQGATSAPKVTFLGEIHDHHLLAPTRIAVSPETDIVVTDPPQGLVHIFGAGGEKLHRFKAGEPLGCAVDAQGRLFIGDQADGSVRVFDALGAPLGALGKGAGEFTKPNELAVDDATKVVFVVDSKAHLVKGYNASGSSLFSTGGLGTTNGKFSFPMGLVLGAGGKTIYVGDHNNHRVQVLSASGAWQKTIGSFGTGKGQLTRPQGLAIDKQGRLYVAEGLAGRVQVFDQLGNHLAFIGTNGTGTGQLSLPTDVVVDSHNRLLVTSYSTRKIVIFGLDTFTTPPKPIQATLRVHPSTLHKANRHTSIKIFVELAKGSPQSILLKWVRLNGTLAPTADRVRLGDADGDKIPDGELLFSRAELLKLLGPGKHKLTLLGRLSSSALFAGQQTITVKE